MTDADDLASDAPALLPWTALFRTADGGHRAADLEHHAPLPRVGEAIEYIDEAGGRRWYRVEEVVHTLQSAADTRPRVEEGSGAPNATPRHDGPPEEPGASGYLRAGLPRVYLAPIPDHERKPMMTDEQQKPDAGAYIGRKPEFAAETIPGGVQPDDERVAAGQTQTGEGGGDESPPSGHREGAAATDDTVREAGQDG